MAGGKGNSQTADASTQPLASGEFHACINEFKTSLNERFDDLKRDFTAKIDEVKDYVDNEVTRLVKRMENIESRAELVKNDQETRSDNDPFHSFDNCIVVSGLSYSVDEDINYKISTLFETLGRGDTVVVAAKRVGRGSTPIVKVALEPGARAEILKNKGSLRRIRAYTKVYLRPSKPLWERNMEANRRLVANMMPGFRCSLRW